MSARHRLKLTETARLCQGLEGEAGSAGRHRAVQAVYARRGACCYRSKLSYEAGLSCIGSDDRFRNHGVSSWRHQIPQDVHSSIHPIILRRSPHTAMQSLKKFDMQSAAQ